MPSRWPTHFGPSGLPDAWSQKTWWTVFLIPVLQLGLSAVLWWAYRYPQYSNIPSMLVISALPEPTRSMMFRLIRNMIVVIGVVVNLIMAQIVLGIASVGFGVTERFNPWMILLLVTTLLAIIVRYTVAVYRLTKGVVSPAPTSGEKKSPSELAGSSGVSAPV